MEDHAVAAANMPRLHGQSHLLGGVLQSERPEYVFLAAAKVGGIQANNT
jgi:hypothetical protein